MPRGYIEESAPQLVFRPHIFRNNARDVATLAAELEKLAPRYTEIKKPTIIITGDKDTIVSPEIHSLGLERDIAGAELVIGNGVGHKPDYAMTEEVIKAIEKVSR